MQPLSPKQQPWVMAKAPSHPKAMARSTAEAKAPVKPLSVQRELASRERIEQRAMQRLEKLHDAVSLDRQARVSLL